MTQGGCVSEVKPTPENAEYFLSSVFVRSPNDAMALDRIISDLKARNAKLERVLEPLQGHDEKYLKYKISMLKQSDGEGWAVGELLERAIAARSGE